MCPESTIKGATLENGRYSCEPKEYFSVINKKISAHMRWKLVLPREKAAKIMKPLTISQKSSKQKFKPPKGKRKKPTWWDTFFNRKAKNIDGRIYTRLMSPVTEEEVRKMITDAAPHKSPGEDGLTIDLLKVVALEGKTCD